DDCQQVVNADGVVDGPVEELGALAGDTGAGRVWVEDDGVAGGEHADGVARERRQRVRHGRDGADDAERSVLGQRDAVLAAVSVGAQDLDAGGALGTDDQLLDLVRQPAELGLFKLFAAELFGLFDTDLADAGDGLAAILQAAGLELPLRLRRRLNGAVHVVEHAPAAGLAG